MRSRRHWVKPQRLRDLPRPASTEGLARVHPGIDFPPSREALFWAGLAAALRDDSTVRLYVSDPKAPKIQEGAGMTTPWSMTAEMLASVEAGDVELHRTLSTGVDFYQVRWHVRSRRASPHQSRALDALLGDLRIDACFGGVIGPGVVTARIPAGATP